MRKQAGLEMTDRIRIIYTDEQAASFDASRDWITSETLATSATLGQNLAIERA